MKRLPVACAPAILGSCVLVGLATGCSPIDARGGRRDAAPSRSGGAAGAVEAHDPIGLGGLDAVLWMQTAVEYRATSLQAYGLATRALEEGLADPGWTAALEQDEGFDGLPPAVILDVDETVLDNSYFQARLVLDGQVYSSELWDPWVREVRAGAVPGALDFCKRAAARGVTVFYVTNRRARLEEATRENLAREGFPLRDDIDTILTRGEIPEWEPSDKTPRRRHVASTHRIVLLIGDNMGDFVAASEGTVAERSAAFDQYRDYWGTRWITLANPTYGSWLNSLIDFDFAMPPQQQQQAKKDALETRR